MTKLVPDWSRTDQSRFSISSALYSSEKSQRKPSIFRGALISNDQMNEIAEVNPVQRLIRKGEKELTPEVQKELLKSLQGKKRF